MLPHIRWLPSQGAPTCHQISNLCLQIMINYDHNLIYSSNSRKGQPTARHHEAFYRTETTHNPPHHEYTMFSNAWSVGSSLNSLSSLLRTHSLTLSLLSFSPVSLPDASSASVPWPLLLRAGNWSSIAEIWQGLGLKDRARLRERHKEIWTKAIKHGEIINRLVKCSLTRAP